MEDKKKKNIKINDFFRHGMVSDNNLNEIKFGNEIKIRKFIYDEKSGMALEDKNKNINIIKNDKEVNINNQCLEMNIMVNRKDIDILVKKIVYNGVNNFWEENQHILKKFENFIG